MLKLDWKPEPKVIRPFDDEALASIRTHVAHVRAAFDAPGAEYPDASFNRWFWHNLPALVRMHHNPAFILKVCSVFDLDLKPSYAFLSMYGAEGVCPVHQDRPQCQYTVDLQLDADCAWPIYVEDKPYVLNPGEALCYSGTGQVHYRKPMAEDSKMIGLPNIPGTFMNLAFFHFVPTSWVGKLS